MVLESTMICVDNSDYMRNGDFIPSRMQSQFDAVNMVSHAKTRSNPENNVGLLSLADNRVLVTLTTDVGKIISKLHQVKPKGNCDLIRGIKVANLALKHRLNKNQKPRVIMFIASPIVVDHAELTKLSKRLKKEKVNVDIINFGEESNDTILNEFINTINGKEGTGSHFVSIAAPANVSDALFSSSMFQSDDGSSLPAGFGPGFQYGMEDDPELAMALRISMEETRLKQEADAKKATGDETMETDTAQPSGEDDLLQQALALSLSQQDDKSRQPDFSSMTEEEQLNYALQMSMAAEANPTTSNTASEGAATGSTTRGVDDTEMKEEDDDYTKAMNDPEFLQRVISSLPGVDPNSDAFRSAFENITKDEKNKEKDASKKDESDKSDKK